MMPTHSSNNASLAGLATLSLLCGLMATTGHANAHGFDPSLADARLSAATVTIVVPAPAAALAAYDDDHDKRLSAAEVKRHRKSIERDVAAALSLTDEGGKEGERIMFDVSTPHAHDGARAATALRVTLHARFARPPTSVKLVYRFAKFATVRLHARRMSAHRVVTDRVPVAPSEWFTLDAKTDTVTLFATVPTTSR